MESLILKDKKFITSLLWRSFRWHLNYLFTKAPLPLACGLYLTSKCNFKCNFCNIWRKIAPTTLSFAKAKNIIRDLSDTGCFYLSFTGGEPLLVDYIFDLLTYAKRGNIKYIHLVTNGYLLDVKSASRLKETGINEISISIDAREELHDKNRGVAGAYNKAIMAIENLKKYAPDIKIVLNAIFSPEEPFECFHVLELAQRYETYVKVQPLNQHPIFDKDNYSHIYFKNIQCAKIKEAVAKLREDRRVVNSDIFLDNIYNFFCQKERLVLKDSPCLFGYHHIEILEDANMYPCLEGLNWQNGFNFNGSLRDILHSNDYKSILEKLKNCQGCQRNYYICYYEPRICFPLNNFLRYVLH